jgi:hypothetical protein
MSKMCDGLETALFNGTLRGITFTAPANIYLALHTGDPTDAGTANEISTSGTGYARQSITFTAPTDGVGSNSGTISFPTAVTSWGTVSYFTIWDAATAGNPLIWGALTPAHNVTAGSQLQFPAGSVQVTYL